LQRNPLHIEKKKKKKEKKSQMMNRASIPGESCNELTFVGVRYDPRYRNGWHRNL